MFSKSVRLFSLAGIDIKLDPSWLLLAALITWSLSESYFPQQFPGQSPQVYLAMSFVAMLCLFASLLAHELAHSLVARGFGVPIKSITLFLFGGVAELGKDPESAQAEFYVALAGPVMSLSLALGFWIIGWLGPSMSLPPEIIAILVYLALINLVLGIFNLAPAFPLDGGRILRAYLWKQSGDILYATKIASQSGSVFAYLLMSLGIWELFGGALTSGLWLILIGGFILMAARSSYQAQLARSAFEGVSVGALMTRNPITVSPDLTLSALVEDVMLPHGVSFVPVVEAGVLLGHIETGILKGIDRENWSGMQVGDVFVGLDPKTSVSEEASVQDLLARIGRTGRRKFLVTQEHELRGVISLSDLTRFLNPSGPVRQRPVAATPSGS